MLLYDIWLSYKPLSWPIEMLLFSRKQTKSKFPALSSTVPWLIRLIPEINVTGVGSVPPCKFQPDRFTGLRLVCIVTDRHTDRQTGGGREPLTRDLPWATRFSLPPPPLASLGVWSIIPSTLQSAEKNSVVLPLILAPIELICPFPVPYLWYDDCSHIHAPWLLLSFAECEIKKVHMSEDNCKYTKAQKLYIIHKKHLHILTSNYLCPLTYERRLVLSLLFLVFN